MIATRSGLASQFPSSAGLPPVVEVCVLLPGWQVSLLESAARQRGLTSGQLVRRILGDLLEHLAGSAQELAAAEQPRS